MASFLKRFGIMQGFSPKASLKEHRDAPSAQSLEDKNILQSLEVLSQEERRFRNHWLWQYLRCTPEEFFEKFKTQWQQELLQNPEYENTLTKAKQELQKQIQPKRKFRLHSSFVNYKAISV